MVCINRFKHLRTTSHYALLPLDVKHRNRRLSCFASLTIISALRQVQNLLFYIRLLGFRNDDINSTGEGRNSCQGQVLLPPPALPSKVHTALAKICALQKLLHQTVEVDQLAIQVTAIAPVDVVRQCGVQSKAIWVKVSSRAGMSVRMDFLIMFISFVTFRWFCRSFLESFQFHCCDNISCHCP